MADHYMLMCVLMALAVGELYAGCTFYLNEHVPKNVIMIDVVTPSIVYPNNHNAFKVPTGARMKVSCGDKYFRKNFKKSKDLLIRCNHNDSVNANGKRVRLGDLECDDFPKSLVKKRTDKKCYKNNTVFEIGFQESKTFLNVIHACFDHLEQNAIYTWYDSSMLPKGHQSKVDRPYFVHDNLYSFSIDDVYRSKYQREHFAKVLNSTELANKYIKDDGAHFLSRGHLTPKADFVYGVEQSATFHYINAAPQWQIFNGGNWNEIEMSVRNELEKTNKRYIFWSFFTFSPVFAARSSVVVW